MRDDQMVSPVDLAVELLALLALLAALYTYLAHL